MNGVKFNTITGSDWKRSTRSRRLTPNKITLLIKHKTQIMKLNDYQVLALRTAGSPGVTAWSGETDRQTINVQTDLLHGAMGVCTAGGKIALVATESMIHGKAISLADVKLHVGETLRSLAILCRCGGFTMEDAAAASVGAPASIQIAQPTEHAIQPEAEDVLYNFPGGYTVAKGADEARWSVANGGKVVAQTAPDGRTLYPTDSNESFSQSWLIIAQGIITDHYKPKAAAPEPVKAEPTPEAEPPPAAPAATTEGGTKL